MVGRLKLLHRAEENLEREKLMLLVSYEGIHCGEIKFGRQ
jgi:hypothetical protein